MCILQRGEVSERFRGKNGRKSGTRGAGDRDRNKTRSGEKCTQSVTEVVVGTAEVEELVVDEEEVDLHKRS